MKIKLWTINKWLMFTGFRLFVVTGEWTKLELSWVGLPGSAGWKSWQGE